MNLAGCPCLKYMFFDPLSYVFVVFGHELAHILQMNTVHILPHHAQVGSLFLNRNPLKVRQGTVQNFRINTSVACSKDAHQNTRPSVSQPRICGFKMVKDDASLTKAWFLGAIKT